MNIEEIALRVAEEMRLRLDSACGCADCRKRDGPPKIIAFAQALLAELSKDAVPVAYMSSRNNFICKENKNPEYNIPLFTHPAPVIASEQKPVAEYVGASVIQVIADYIEPGTKLFTSPPNTAGIEQRVAEACAELIDSMYVTERAAEAIRAGLWKEYL